jgi:signal transduction histidine kinase
VIRRVGPGEPMLAMARDIIDRQATHLARLVDELLDVSRISQGKIVLKKDPVELAKVLAQSLETVRPLAEAREQRLTVDITPRPVWLSGDAARLSQVFSNLLNNACKYTPEGGRVHLSASAEDGEARIVVEDDGTGIDPQLLPRIFELFVQGERGLDRAAGGLGIGLTLVKRLVELHHGRVEAYSAGAGRGSTFTVCLPCMASVSERSESVTPVARSEDKVYGRRVLVVD